MIRKFFLLAILATSACLGQNQGMIQGGQQPPTANIYVVSGFYGTGVYVVPSGGYLPPAGTVGMSLVNQSGISASTPIETGLESTLGPRPIVYGSPYYGSPYYGSPYYGVYGAGYGVYGASAAAPGYASEAAPETQGRLIYDMGPSYFAGATAPSGPSMSLAEIAAKYKTSHSRSVRTYTNADGERLTNKVTIRGTPINEKAAPANPPGTAPTPPPPK